MCLKLLSAASAHSSASTAPVLRADVVQAFTAGRTEDVGLTEGRS